MCDLYPRNYYSWTTLQILLPQYTVSDMLQEVKRNRDFFCTHITDYSALYRRQVLFKELMKSEEIKPMIQSDIEIVTQQMTLYGENDSIRIHLECLSQLLIQPAP